MQYAIILEHSVIDDVPARQKVIDAVRHTSGVRTLDLEIAANGLLLAGLANEAAAEEVAKLEGVSSVERMGVKKAWTPPA